MTVTKVCALFNFFYDYGTKSILTISYSYKYKTLNVPSNEEVNLISRFAVHEVIRTNAIVQGTFAIC